jgi:DNA helicase TIP49 (TBP-interacting protein)
MSKLKIGEREFEMDRLNINDIMVMDEKIGDITKLGQEEKLRDKLKNIRYVVWYALHLKDESLTEEDVGKLITVFDAQKTVADFLEAVGITVNPTLIPEASKTLLLS